MSNTPASVESDEPSEDLARLEELDRVVIRERGAGGGGGPSCPSCQYVVLDPGGRQLLFAAEQAGLVRQLLAGQARAFHVDLLDTSQRVVMKLRRPYAVGGDRMEVSVRGAPAAVVRREPTLLKPVLSVADPHGAPLLRVKGPVSISSSCDFHLYSTDKQRVGVIRKRWSGAGGGGGDGGGETDNFALVFPPQAPLHTKAAVIATALLIDFLFYM